MKNLLFFTLICLLIFYGCSKCGHEIETNYMSYDDIEIIPYKGNDTIKFTVNGGPVESFVGQGVIRGLIRSPFIENRDADCINNRYDEKFICKFKNLNNQGKDITISLYYGLTVQTSFYVKEFCVEYNGFQYITSPENYYYPGTLIFQTIDTVLINNKPYLVRHLINYDYLHAPLLYNKINGIIRFSTPTDTLEKAD